MKRPVVSTKTQLRGTAALLALLAVVSACSTHAAQRPVPQAGDPSTTLSAAEHLLTDDSAAQRRSWYLRWAEQVLDQRCMRRAGYRYLTDPGPEPARGSSTQDAVGTAQPATYGVVWTGSAGLLPEDRYIAGLTTAQRGGYVLALNGSAQHTATLRLPSGVLETYRADGCLSTARAELYGSLTSAIEAQTVPQDMRILRDAALNTDPGYMSVLRDWQLCMGIAGWTYKSPQAAIQAFQFRATQAGGGRQQLAAGQTAVAGADRACDARTGLRARAVQEQQTYLSRLSTGLLSVLRTLESARARAYRHALQVLSPSPR